MLAAFETFPISIGEGSTPPCSPSQRKALRGSEGSPASPCTGRQAELLVGKLRHGTGQLHPECHEMLMAGHHPPQERGTFAVPCPAPTPGIQQDIIFLSQAFVSIPAGNGCQASLVFVQCPLDRTEHDSAPVGAEPAVLGASSCMCCKAGLFHWD